MKTIVLLLLAAAVCILQSSASTVKFGSLCSGNPSNTQRGCDQYGCGNYGATRDGGKREHQGLDIECTDNSTIFAPFDVELKGKAVPYKINNAINNGVRLCGAGLCFKLFYLKPDKYKGKVKKGQQLGTLLPMQNVYPGITSHVHVQMCNKTDPTSYF